MAVWATTQTLSSSRPWADDTLKKRVSSGSPLEPVIGFCRAVRTGNRILVAGTAAIEPDGNSTPGGAAEQMERCCVIVEKAIRDLGGHIDDSIRTCIYLTDRADFMDVARIHGRWFGKARPVTTTIVVAGFIRPEWVVEIEVEAVVEDGVS